MTDPGQSLYEAINLIADAHAQIKYLQEKFGETGSGNAVMARLQAFLNKRQDEIYQEGCYD
jgi:hypothetical protein